MQINLIFCISLFLCVNDLQGSEKSVTFAADLRCASLDSICFDDLCTRSHRNEPIKFGKAATTVSVLIERASCPLIYCGPIDI